MVGDYRDLNNRSKDDNFPLPALEDILRLFARKKYFSSYDMAMGFHQILLDTFSQEHKALIFPFGSFTWTRLPFGIKQAPGIFQRSILLVLWDLRSDCSCSLHR